MLRDRARVERAARLVRAPLADVAAMAAVLRDQRGVDDSPRPPGHRGVIDDGRADPARRSSIRRRCELWVADPQAGGRMRAFDLRHELRGEGDRAAPPADIPADPAADPDRVAALAAARAELRVARAALAHGDHVARRRSVRRARARAPALARSARARRRDRASARRRRARARMSSSAGSTAAPTIRKAKNARARCSRASGSSDEREHGAGDAPSTSKPTSHQIHRVERGSRVRSVSPYSAGDACGYVIIGAPMPCPCDIWPNRDSASSASRTAAASSARAVAARRRAVTGVIGAARVRIRRRRGRHHRIAHARHRPGPNGRSTAAHRVRVRRHRRRHHVRQLAACASRACRRRIRFAWLALAFSACIDGFDCSFA